jgi:DNA-binding MarR family transcriptional regulator
MSPEKLLLDALLKFKAQNEQCYRELSNEINISELKVKQFHYVELIYTNRPLTFSRFAEILEITKPSVTNIVNQLIKLGIVYKKQCNRDGRRYYVELSEKGKKIVQFHNLQQQRLAKRIIEALNEEEIGIFVGLINKIVSN